MSKKEKKPFYKRWWFIAIVVIVIIGAVGGGKKDDKKMDEVQEATVAEATTESTTEETTTTTEETTTTETTLSAEEAAAQARQEWIESQFSIWDGSHKELTTLIKTNLNDEKSYEHINTVFVDVNSQERVDIVNMKLAALEIDHKVKIGDLFIDTEFSAKNGFNATIKSHAYGVATESDNMIYLLGIK